MTLPLGLVDRLPKPAEWRFLATVDRVPWLRGQVRDALADVEVDREGVALAVTEAMSNVVLHAYPAPAHGEALVRMTMDGECVVVSVRDFGVGQEGFASSPNRGMGLGFRFMRSAASQMRIEPGATGTAVVMSFPLSA